MPIPRRAAPGCARSGRRAARSEECSCQGTLVTITPGVNSSRPFSRSALWLCRMCSHQWPTTYSGTKTATTSRGVSRRSRLTKSRTGRVISRYGDSSTVSGTGSPRRSHSSCSARVSSSSTLTVSAVSVSGRVARAYASARRVGLCSLETSTTACTRLGSIAPSSSGTSSSDTEV